MIISETILLVILCYLPILIYNMIKGVETDEKSVRRYLKENGFIEEDSNKEKYLSTDRQELVISCSNKEGKWTYELELGNQNRGKLGHCMPVEFSSVVLLEQYRKDNGFI